MREQIDTWRPGHAWPLFEGGALLMLGLLAVLLPAISRFAWAQVTGAVLLSAGVIGLISSLAMHRARGLRWPLLSSLLATVAGVLLLLSGPALARSYLTALVFVLADGLMSVGYGLARRSARHRGWGWMIVGSLGELACAAWMARSLLAMDSTGMTLMLPGIALGWDGLMLVLLGWAAREPREMLIDPI
jgi:uncharacterized membrane protein HdeD (DUF308 family)